MVRPSPALLGATFAGCVAFGCVTPPSKGDKKPDLTNTTLWTLKSEDFSGGATIPAAFTCEGAGKSPELEWNAGPDGTQSYALVLKDISIIERMPDAATRSGAYYWALWNVPATTLQIPQGLSASLNPPEVEGATQWSTAGSGYAAPCPNGASEGAATPALDHFVFTLYALPSPTVDAKLDSGGNVAEALDANLRTAALGDVDLLFTSNARLETGGAGGAGGAPAE
jgi:phosphatidylethanolamine-binding protein (PEBP) family uncharacterized protein